MNLFVIALPILAAHLSLFGKTDSKLLDESNLQQELRNYEIVAPHIQTQGLWRRDVSTRSSLGDHINRAVFYLRGFGKKFLLDVTQNSVLISANYLSRSFDADGGEVISRHEKSDNCFYQGTVQGAQHSIVAISTCHGIEGMVYDGNETYFIQPLPGKTDQHIMYRPRDMVQGEKQCGVDYRSSVPVVDELISLGKHRARRNLQSETKYVELVIVNDHSQYLDLKSIVGVEERSKNIANVVDSLFRPMNIRVALTMVEIWHQRDLIEVVEDSDACLDNFMVYRNGDLWKKRKHDNAMLLTHRSFKGSIVGKAAVMAMCGRKSGGVVQDHTPSAAATAATMAHEMGHNFGMLHDENIEGCKCDSPAEDQGCIMSEIAKSKPSTEWSTCSLESYEKYLKRGMDSCLFNTPASLFGGAVCGNGFKEEGEECDCGTVEECKKYGDVCCNATTCKLHPDSECGTGPCCANCKLKPQGFLCREKVNECDLPEFCTGKSGLCPNNKYVQDGRPCSDNKGYCYNGECPTHDEQCQDLWGQAAKSGPDECYRWNERGTVRGNCGPSLQKCSSQNKLCGMLQCTNIDGVNLPIIGTDRSGYEHRIGDTLCKSASLSLGLDVPDPGMTMEGTKCGENKLCLGRNCTSIETLTAGVKKCPNNCFNENGICNNEGECFCLSCWQGPDCSKWVECEAVEGTGGPQVEKRSNLAGILAAVLICILLVIAAVCTFIYREQLMQKWRTFKQKTPGSYQGLYRGSPNQKRGQSGPAARTSHDVEAAKSRPNISGPTLNSTTRNQKDVTLKRGALGSGKPSSEPVKQDQPDAQPLVALKPTPKKLEKPASEKEETTAKYSPPKMRNREWPPKDDKRASLNRVSSPTGISNPVKPIRPKSHAGILGKPPVPPLPSGRGPVKPAKPSRPESLAGVIDKREPAKPLKPKRPESHAGVIDKPVAPSWKKNVSQSSTGNKKLQATDAVNPPNVAGRPPLRAVDSRFPKQSSEERPASLPLKPSDLKKAGLASGSKKPSSFSSADNKPNKVALKPPGPIPPRPGAKPT